MSKNKNYWLQKIYSVFNYLFIFFVIAFLMIRLTILSSPYGDKSGIFVSNEVIYLFNSIPLSWFKGYYLYELSTGTLRAAVITSIIIVIMNKVLARRNYYSFTSQQKIIYKMAVVVIILALLAIVSYLIFFVWIFSGFNDWQF